MIPKDATHQSDCGKRYYKRGLKFWYVFDGNDWEKTKVPVGWYFRPINIK